MTVTTVLFTRGRAMPYKGLLSGFLSLSVVLGMWVGPRETDATVIACPTASPCLLSTLIATQDSVQVGDKLFSQFADSGDFSPTLASVVQITGVTTAGQYGLDVTFPITISIAPVFSPSFEGTLTVTVGTTDPHEFLHDMAGLLTTVPTGGLQQIVDTATLGSTTLRTGLLAANSNPHAIPTLSYDTPFTSNVATVSLTRDFTFFGTMSGTLDTSLTFSQAFVVPEPASWLLVALGLGGLAAARRLRR